MNTIHTDDLSGATFATAEWMSGLGRQKADAVAGETIIFHNQKSNVKKVEGMVAHDEKVIAPLFNLVSLCIGSSLPMHHLSYYFRRMTRI